MNGILLKLDCPEYKPGTNLDINAVSRCIDQALLENYAGKKVVLRAIQSQHHNMSHRKLISYIQREGTDRYAEDGGEMHQSNVTDQPIDLFGKVCTIKPSSHFSLQILEGFHKWAPKALERPQTKADIWLVYDKSKLKRVSYRHQMYKVVASDGYVFRDPRYKLAALIGIITI